MTLAFFQCIPNHKNHKISSNNHNLLLLVRKHYFTDKNFSIVFILSTGLLLQRHVSHNDHVTVKCVHITCCNNRV